MSFVPGLSVLLENVPELRTPRGILRAVATFFGLFAVALFVLTWLDARTAFVALLLQLALYGVDHYLLRSYFAGRVERLPYTEAFFNRFLVASAINAASLGYILLTHGGTARAVRLVPSVLGWLAALYLLASAVLLFVRGVRAAGVDTIGGVYIYFPDQGRQVEEAVYNVVRHPLYAALDRTAIAFALINGTPFALFLAVFFVGVWHPVWYGMEERELVDRFGETYKSYRERVPAVMPANLTAELKMWEALIHRATPGSSPSA